MALQQTINIPIGSNLNFKYIEFNYCTKNSIEVLENAYIKINNLTGNKSLISLNIGIYDKKDGTLVLSDNFNFVPDVSNEGKNFLQQGYNELKVSKYKDAVDLLDEGQTVA